MEAAIYKPFGEQTEVLQPTQVNQEQKGWIGERYDADAGLQYLNARYYDPEYGFFLQPDWFEVTAGGVGTNRYSYAFNDPVNMRDPGGNAAVYSDSDGDGDNEYMGQVEPGEPGYGEISCGCGLGGNNPTAGEWARINDAIRFEQSGRSASRDFSGPVIQFPNFNPVFADETVLRSPLLSRIWSSPSFATTAQQLLSISQKIQKETGIVIYEDPKTGEFYGGAGVYTVNSDGTFRVEANGYAVGGSTYLDLNVRFGIATLHTHWSTRDNFGNPLDVGPSLADINAAGAAVGVPGMIVQPDGRVIGYGY